MAIVLIEQFQIQFSQVSLLTGYNLCAVGACGIFISAFARKFGKRPLTIFSISCSLAGSIWAAVANSYPSLVGARVLQGIGIAMFESVTFAIVGDLYFVHQRGTRMAAYVAFQSGLANLPGLIAGKITMDLGWRSVFWLLCIFLGIGWLLIVLFCWETQFNRPGIYNTDISSQDVSELLMEFEYIG